VFQQLAGIDYPTDPDVAFSYDTLGRRIGLTDASGSTSWSYDSLGRLASTTQGSVGKTLTYGYNIENRRTSLTVDDRSITYTYYSTGKLRALSDSVVEEGAPFLYDYRENADWVEVIENPAGGQIGKTHDLQGRLQSTSYLTANNNLAAQAGYTYDKAGQRTTETGLRGNVSFGYDEKRQLTSASGLTAGTAPAKDYGFSYDAIGNRIAVDEDGNVTEYQKNNLNQYISVSTASVPPAYDPNGNLTGINGTTYRYDQENRLVSFLSSTAQSTFLYDGLGRRVQTSDSGSNPQTTRFLYDGLLPIAELNGNNEVVRHVTRGLDLSGSMQGAGGIGGILATTTANGETGFYFADGNGNITKVIDGSGTVLASYTYDPYGNKLAESGAWVNQPYQWSSKEFHAASGLVYYLYRWYAPELGRWPNRDPIEEKGGVNLYGFVENDGLNQWDYLGQFSLNYTPPPNSSVTPFELGVEWLTGSGTRHRDFKDGDDFAEQMRSHKHIQTKIKEVSKAVTGKCNSNCSYAGPYSPPASSSSYKLGGIEGVVKYLGDYSNLLTFGKFGNLAVTFSGSYDATFTVTNIDCCANTADLEIVTTNSSHAASALRPPVLGYTDWWQKHVAPRINKLFQSGPGSPTTQKVTLTEKLTLSSNCP